MKLADRKLQALMTYRYVYLSATGLNEPRKMANGDHELQHDKLHLPATPW